MSEIKIEISTKKIDIGSLVGPVLAIIAAFLPWFSFRIFGIYRNISGLDTSVGVLYFLLALVAVIVAWKTDLSTKAKGLMVIGSLMAIFSIGNLLNAAYNLSMMQSELKGNPFGGLAGADIEIGIIVAIIASIIIVYTGYKLSSPDLSSPLHKTSSRKVLMILNSIFGLWALLILGFTISTADKTSDSVVVTLFFASLIMIISFFYMLYSLLKLKERNKLVYSAFAGIAAVLLILIGRFTAPVQADVLLTDSIVFGIFPLLVFIANLWYARKVVIE